jgi:hypothetical protein
VLSKRLEELGVTSGKTYNLKFPTEDQMPLNLLSHFIRGFSDGDGHISKDACTMVATVDFCEGLKLFVENTLNLPTFVGNPKGSDKRINRISISGAVNSIRFQDFLYKDATIYLQRKYDKYKENLALILDKKQHYSNGKSIAYQNEKAMRLF